MLPSVSDIDLTMDGEMRHFSLNAERLGLRLANNSSISGGSVAARVPLSSNFGIGGVYIAPSSSAFEANSLLSAPTSFSRFARIRTRLKIDSNRDNVFSNSTAVFALIAS